jgi:hypothetical protein
MFTIYNLPNDYIEYKYIVFSPINSNEGWFFQGTNDVDEAIQICDNLNVNFCATDLIIGG